MNHLDLFSGIGGFAYAAQQVWGSDHNVVAFVEQDKYCQKVLAKHWPDVPIIDDIKEYRYENVVDSNSKRGSAGCGEVQKEDGEVSKFRNRSSKGNIYDTNTKRSDVEGQCEHRQGQGQYRRLGSKPETIDLLTGGFPCQPFSVAGNRKGKEDDRYLWPEMFRVIQEAKPTWIIGENVPGLINMGLETTVLDLEKEGYEVELLVLGAVAVQALHQRQRVWIIAHRKCMGRQEGAFEAIQWQQERQDGTQYTKGTSSLSKASEDVANSNSRGCPPIKHTRGSEKEDSRGQDNIKQGGTEPDIKGEDVANSDNSGSGTPEYDSKREGQKDEQEYEGQPQHRTSRYGSDVSDTDTERLQGDCRPIKPKLGNMADGLSAQLGKLGMIWDSEPDIPRVAIGIKDRVKKLKALGNAIVPACVMPIMWAIKEIETRKEDMG